MKKLLLMCTTFVLTIIGSSAWAQSNVAVAIMPGMYGAIVPTYRDYSKFVKEYNRNNDLEKLSKRYDLLAVMLMDATYVDAILEFDPSLEEDYYYYKWTIEKCAVESEIDTKLKSLKKLRLASKHINNVIKTTYGDKAPYVSTTSILPMGDSIALTSFTTLSGDGGALYYLRLKDKQMQIIPLYSELTFDNSIASADYRNNFGLGIRGGIGVSNLDYMFKREDGEGTDSQSLKSKLSKHLGLVYDVRLNKSATAFLQLGAFYYSQGGTNEAVESTSEFALDYLRIPVLLTYRFSGNNSAVETSFGFYYAKGIGGTVKITEGNTTNSYKAFSKSEANLNNSDFGVSVGFNFIIKRFVIGLSLDMGTNDLLKGSNIEVDDPNFLSLRNNSYTLTLGYNLNLHKKK